jgi:hypothetical protein
MKARLRGTRAVHRKTRFLTGRIIPTQHLNSADGVKGLTRILFLELVEDIGQPDVQRLGDAGTIQQFGVALEIFDIADSGTADPGFVGEGLVGHTAFLPEPCQFLNDLFYQ